MYTAFTRMPGSCDIFGEKLFPFVGSVEIDEALDLGGVYVPCIYSHAR